MPDVSIKDVARLAGVSIATVSRCINNPAIVAEKTLLKVQAAIRETRYAPNKLAQSFRRGRTNLIVVVVPSIGDPILGTVVTGARNAANNKGFEVLIEETQLNKPTADHIEDMIASQQADGILLLACVSRLGSDVLSVRKDRRLPIVIGFETIPGDVSEIPSVHVDNIAAAKEATNFLISLGHRRIGMIHDTRDSPLTKDRESGYRAAMEQAGLVIEESWVVEGKLSIDGARHATRTILDQEYRPSAIFCTNDEMAIGCLHEAKAAKLRVPDDISVLGFDDIRYAKVTDPPLTTIGQPAAEIGERAMNRLCREIETGRCESGVEIVPHELIVRESVAAPSS